MSAVDGKLPIFPLWEVPVYVRIGDGPTETIDGPDEALKYLLTRWPAQRGPAYHNAKKAYEDAVEDHGSLEVAWEAFLAAVGDASLLA